MGKTRSAYPPEFRRQMVELVRAGSSDISTLQAVIDRQLVAGERETDHWMVEGAAGMALAGAIGPNVSRCPRRVVLCVPTSHC
jgi:hypothetical protein